MNSPRRESLWRNSLLNATVLSAIYLVGAAVVELALNRWPGGVLLRVAHSLDFFPVRFLKPLGLLESLQTAYARGDIDELTARLVLGFVTVAFIYALSLLVGGVMWCLRFFLERRQRSV